MAMSIQDIRRRTKEQREDLLRRYRDELMDLNAQLSAGGSIDNPSRISDLKKTIARLLTIKREEELGINE